MLPICLLLIRISEFVIVAFYILLTTPHKPSLATPVIPFSALVMQGGSWRGRFSLQFLQLNFNWPIWSDLLVFELLLTIFRTRLCFSFGAWLVFSSLMECDSLTWVAILVDVRLRSLRPLPSYFLAPIRPTFNQRWVTQNNIVGLARLRPTTLLVLISERTVIALSYALGTFIFLLSHWSLSDVLLHFLALFSARRMQIRLNELSMEVRVLIEVKSCHVFSATSRYTSALGCRWLADCRFFIRVAWPTDQIVDLWPVLVLLGCLAFSFFLCKVLAFTNLCRG